jgi:hypothetical protein
MAVTPPPPIVTPPLRPQAAELGQYCILDTDCANWSIFGRIACCKNICVRKDVTLQTCDAYCEKPPGVYECGSEADRKKYPPPAAPGQPQP